MTAEDPNLQGPASTDLQSITARLGQLRLPPVATYGPWLSLIAMIVIFPMFNSSFISTTNMLNILRQSSVLLVLALSATFIVLMGSIDLSVGSVVSLCGMGGAILLADYGEPAVFLVLLIGVAAGAVNGVLFAYGRLPSFLVTLGTLFALQGITLYWSDGIASVVDPDLTVSNYFSGDLWEIPIIHDLGSWNRPRVNVRRAQGLDSADTCTPSEAGRRRRYSRAYPCAATSSTRS